jgi:hypothetical protein
MASEYARQNSLKAVEMLRTLFTNGELDPEEDSRPDETIFRITTEGPAPKIIARVLLDKQRFVVHFFFARPAPPELRSKVAEYITRVNCGLIAGNLEMSFDSGVIRYKSSIDFTNIELAELLVRNVMLSAMENVEQLAMPLWDVLDEDAEPEAAAGAAGAREDAARFEP